MKNKHENVKSLLELALSCLFSLISDQRMAKLQKSITSFTKLVFKLIQYQPFLIIFNLNFDNL